MTSQVRSIRLGTRGSALARWQTDHVAALLSEHDPSLRIEIVPFTTRGDAIIDVPLPEVGGKGLFTAELEQALYEGNIDLAVHSLKDLPTDDPAGLTIGAIPPRASAQDALISRSHSPISQLPVGAAIGSSSNRRAAQILRHRSDLRVIDIRGNVDTRLKKALDPDGPYDAIVLALAGLTRLGRSDAVTELLPFEVMLPAPGQGALAVQCRNDASSLHLLAPLDHRETRWAVTAERAFLAALGGGCAVPVAAYAVVEADSVLNLQGRVSAIDGSAQVDVALSTPLISGDEITQAAALGQSLAELALQRGAQEILGSVS